MNVFKPDSKIFLDEENHKYNFLDDKNIHFTSVTECISEYFEKFNQFPNQLSFLSYDLIWLVYYLILQNNFTIDEKIFTKKTMFKGKVGIFEIKNNKINHILNFYKVENEKFRKIF